jgi:hypothetical protein
MKPWAVRLSALAVGVAVGVIVLLASQSAHLTTPMAPLCPTSGAVQINGTLYFCDSVQLNWNNTSPGVKLNVTFSGVAFHLDWYNTFECPVVNVTAQEPTGTVYTLFVGSRCTPSMPVGQSDYPGPNFFSPHREFGATWVSLSVIQLYVITAY